MWDRRWDRWDRWRQWRSALALLLLGGALGCFTDDGFEYRQCVATEDCNPALDLRGERFACIAGLCEYTLCGTRQEECNDGSNSGEDDGCLQTCHKYTCGDGIVTELAEGCDDGNREDNDGGCDSDCRKIAVAIGSGPAADHVCAISEGQVRCWGRNGEGQLARGNTANLGDEVDELPSADIPRSADARITKVVATQSATCVLKDDGKVHCWGLNVEGLLGTGKVEDILIGDRDGELPAAAVVLGGPAVDIVGGAQHACALMQGGTVRCWGAGESNQLGYMDMDMEAVGDDEVPASRDVLPIAGVVQLAAGRDHTCARNKAGEVFCWGLNSYGQVGYKDEFNIEVPRKDPVQLGAPATQIASGSAHTCALISPTEIRCWGDGFDGALGNNQYDDVGFAQTPAEGKPVAMLAAEDRVARIYAGGAHTCVLLVGGAVRCWGIGSSGQLGNGLTYNFGDGFGEVDGLPAIPPLVDVGGEVLDLALGEATTCALLVGGQVRCWGRNSEGQLGRNDTEWIGDEEGEMPPRDAIIYRTPGRFMSEAL